jgi:hypothetical protein
MAASSCRIDRMASLGALAGCVERVRGHKRYAKSPSDVWWLTFKDGTQANDAVPVYLGVLKYFAARKELSGLGYELRVYEIVQLLLQARVTPNFVATLATFPHVSERELRSLLRADPNFQSEWLDNLRWNLEVMKNFRGSGTMLAVTDSASEPVSSSSASSPRRSLSLSGILTEAMPESTTLAKLLERHELDQYAFASVLFQLVSVCFVMECARIVHGDLHSQNVIVNPLELPVTLAYVLEDRVYDFKTRFTVHVFDFDRSFAAQLGPNKHFKPHKLAPQFDLGTVLCFVAGSMYADPRLPRESYDFQQQLLHDVFGADLVNAAAEQFDSEEGPCRSLRMPDAPTRSLLQYLERLAPYLEPAEFYAAQQDVFVCRRAMFDASGGLTAAPVHFDYGPGDEGSVRL